MTTTLKTLARSVPLVGGEIDINSVHLVSEELHVRVAINAHSAGGVNASVFLTAIQARALAAALVECADHYDAVRAAPAAVEQIHDPET